MKHRSIVVTFVLCLLALSVSFAQNPNLGTWKLNEIAKDGKSRAFEMTYFAAGGKKIHAKYVYDKQ